MNFEDRTSREEVTFNSSICLQTNDGSYFTFNSNGQLKIEKNNKFEMGSLSIAKLTKWQLIDAHNPANRARITSFDDICLKSPFG